MCRRLIKKHIDCVDTVHWSRNGKVLVSSSWDLSVCIWETTTFSITLFAKDYTCSALSSDSTTVATGTRDGTIALWSSTLGTSIATCTGHTDTVYAVEWSPTASLVASSSRDSTIRVWDRQGVCHLVFDVSTSFVGHVGWANSGKHLVTCDVDLTVRVVDATSGVCIHLDQSVPHSIARATWASRSPWLNFSADGVMRRWNTVWNQIKACFGHRIIVCVAWSPDGTLVAESSPDDRVRVWEIATGRLVTKFRGCAPLSWSPDGTTLAVGSFFDMVVKLWPVDRE